METAEIVDNAAASEATPPRAHYLDTSIDLETLPIPVARFPGSERPLLEREMICRGLSAFIKEIAPHPAPVIALKRDVPYYIAGTLKVAEFVGKTRERAAERGESIIGKQRSSSHLDMLGPAVLLDHDGDVFGCEGRLRELGVAAVIYTSHSYGFTKPNATAPSQGGRVMLFLNRPVSPDEYRSVWDALNHLLGGEFDPAGRSPAQCYGRHTRRTPQASFRRVILDGAALDTDALIGLGKSLQPDGRGRPQQQLHGARTADTTAEVERARLLGKVRPPNEYTEWMSGAGAFKRAYPSDRELAFRCFDAWSAGSPSPKYEGTEVARRKFEEVPAEYDGPAAPVDLGMLHWRARRRAQKVLSVSYSPTRYWTKLEVFDELEPQSLGAGITPEKGSEPIPRDSLSREDQIIALEYLEFCWGSGVLGEAISGLLVPSEALSEAHRRCEETCKAGELAGRAPHIWVGKNLAEDTATLAGTIISSGAKLFRHDKVLVRLTAPTSDPATAERERKRYHYKGTPDGPGDPALHAGERLAPLSQTDTEVLREMIATGVAEQHLVNRGTRQNPEWHTEYRSFAFKPSANIQSEPDKAVLNDLIKRELPARVPEILGVITAPVMPNLPKSTNAVDLLADGADYILAQLGFDAASGLFLSPLGTVIDVPATPSNNDVKAATELLQLPWGDFPFASPAGGITVLAGLSVVIYGMMIAANRRALEIAPGIAISSHGEGQSTGKTLAAQVLAVLATGDIAAPISLGPDFNEQRKLIVTELLQGDGCLLFDNVPNGVRFDSAPLAAAMTSSRFKDRLLGANKEINVSTRAMTLANGNALNLAGDLASRFMLVKLNTGLERPEDRTFAGFKIPDLRRWVVEHRQQMVAAVHTIVRAYLQACRQYGGTPEQVVARRQIIGSRFGGPCDVLRDAFLWAFPDLPDPFLGFQASADSSSTKGEAVLVLQTLDRIMAEMAGEKVAPSWALTPFSAPERATWEQKFRARWARLSPQEQRRRYGCNEPTAAANKQWERLRDAGIARSGRPEVRAGRARFKSAELIAALPQGGYQPASDDRALLEALVGGKSLSAVSFGRWLKNHLKDAPLHGLVLRSEKDRQGFERFWIERHE